MKCDDVSTDDTMRGSSEEIDCCNLVIQKYNNKKSMPSRE